MALRIDVLAGANDAPEITGLESAATGTVIEAGANGPGTASSGGQLSATDADAYGPLRWQLRSSDVSPAGSGSASLSTSQGSFTITADGAWTYTLSNAAPATQALRAGDSVTDIVLAVGMDEFGATASQTLEVTISGSADPVTGVVIDGSWPDRWCISMPMATDCSTPAKPPRSPTPKAASAGISAPSAACWWPRGHRCDH